MEKPVNVGIPYSNEEERKLAIAQAERLGYEKWDRNDKLRAEASNCIWLHLDGDWIDGVLKDWDETIPLERPEEEIDLSKYNVEHNTDGTIILKPKKKKIKVWIEVFLSNGEVYTAEYSSKEVFEESKERGERGSNYTFLEVIEREYEI